MQNVKSFHDAHKSLRAAILKRPLLTVILVLIICGHIPLVGARASASIASASGNANWIMGVIAINGVEAGQVFITSFCTIYTASGQQVQSGGGITPEASTSVFPNKNHNFACYFVGGSTLAMYYATIEAFLIPTGPQASSFSTERVSASTSPVSAGGGNGVNVVCNITTTPYGCYTSTLARSFTSTTYTQSSSITTYSSSSSLMTTSSLQTQQMPLTPQNPLDLTGNTALNLVIIAVVGVVSVAALVLYYRRSEPQPKKVPTEGVFCMQCGVKLPAGSEFCNRCGAKQA